MKTETRTEPVRRRTGRLLADSIVVVSVAMLVASLPLGIAAAHRIPPRTIVVVGDPNTPGTGEVRAELEERVARGDDLIPDNNPIAAVSFSLFSLLWLATGRLIVGRQRRNFAGWIFLTIGTVAPLVSFCGSVVGYGVKARPGSIPGVGAAAVIGEYGFIAVALVPLLLLWYPDGRPPSPRWRWVSRALFFGVGVAAVGFALTPGPLNNYVDMGILYENPLGIRGFTAGGAVTAAGNGVAFAAALAAFAAVVVRFRRSRGDERQQMRLLALVAGTAGAFLLLAIVGGGIAELVSDQADQGKLGAVTDWIFGIPILIVAFGVPAAYLIAIFRHRLFDIDVVIKKAVIFTVVVLIVTLSYGAVVALIGAATVWENAPPIVFLIGILLGLTFPLVRARARRVADRVVYGKRATPYEVLTEFSGRMTEAYSAEDVLPRMARILAEGTGAESTVVWLRIGAELQPSAGWPGHQTSLPPLHLEGDTLPPFPAGEEAFEVRHRSQLLGALSVRMPAADPMNPSKTKLIEDLASQAGLVLRNVRLIEELRASRRRIVAAQDARAKTLERNIHDGAQQQLVALSVQLGLARNLSKAQPQVDQLLEQLQGRLLEALDDLRDLARGIYPPLLADQGLVAALTAQARKASVPVEVKSDSVGRYQQETEAAVYFCILEALQNVAKYANASNATVRLSSDDGTLTFSVMDDGRGFDTAATSYGTGLQGMADRLEALGGVLLVSSRPGGGTTVTGRLPVQVGR